MKSSRRRTLIGMVLAALLTQRALAGPTQNPPDNGHPPSPPPPEKGEKPKVTRVERWPAGSEVAPFGLNDRMIVHVEHLAAWVKDRTKCGQVILYLNDLPIEGLQPTCNLTPEKERLIFHLVRGNAATAAAWCAALDCTAKTASQVKVSLGMKGADPIETDKNASFRLTSDQKWASLSAQVWAYVPAALLLLLVLVLGFGYGLLRDSVPDVEDVKSRPYSLSRSQFAGWLVLLVGAFCLVWISTGEIPVMTQQLMALLGLTGVTTVAGAALNASQTDRRSSAVATQAALAAPAPPPIRMMSTAGGTAPIVVMPPPPAPPSTAALTTPTSRNFFLDILSEDGALSLSRLQHAVWTLVLWVLFVMTVYRCFGVLDFDKTLLGLMGISSLVYSANKTTEGPKKGDGIKSSPGAAPAAAGAAPKNWLARLLSNRTRKETLMAAPAPLAPARSKPARIVPMRKQKEAVFIAPAVPLLLKYHSGPLLTNVQIFTAFLGAAWQEAPLSDLAGQLNDFFDFIVTSPLIDQLAEYSVPDFPIGQGSFLGSTVVDVALPGVLPDEQVQQILQDQLNSNAAFPQPTANTLYFLFLPPNVVSELQGAQSCRDQCGYHESIDGRIFYAVIPHADCPGCTRGFSLFESLTRVASHELCEAITDPTGEGWFTNPPDGSAGEEIGDLCSEGTKQVGAFQVQTEFSNKQRTCG